MTTQKSNPGEPLDQELNFDDLLVRLQQVNQEHTKLNFAGIKLLVSELISLRGRLNWVLQKIQVIKNYNFYEPNESASQILQANINRTVDYICEQIQKELDDHGTETEPEAPADGSGQSAGN